MRNAGLLLVLAITGCGVGDDATTPSTPDPRVCAANLSITGTFTLAMAPPDLVNNDTQMPPADGIPDIQGCWPTGTWAFTAAVVDTTCPTAPALLAGYQFKADFITNQVGNPTYSYTLQTPAPAAQHFHLKVSSGGGGLCEANMEIFSADGLEIWTLQPALNTFNANGPLTGVGEYAKYMVDQWNGS